MIKTYYIVSIFIFFYEVSTIHILMKAISHASIFVYAFLLWNIGALIYWFFESWSWNDAFRIKNYENEDVTVDSYQFNPLLGTINAWLDKDKKWIVIEGNTLEFLTTKHLEMPMFGVVGLNVLYCIMYTFILLICKK